MSLQGIERRLSAVLARAEAWLPEEELTYFRELVQAGEPGVALEDFCTQLDEHDVDVPGDVARELAQIAFQMKMRIHPRIARIANT
jgi:hypothetical protein